MLFTVIFRLVWQGKHYPGDSNIKIILQKFRLMIAISDRKGNFTYLKALLTCFHHHEILLI